MATYEYGELIYKTDNHISAGASAVRLEAAVYNRLLDNMFDQVYGGIVTAKEAKNSPSERFQQAYKSFEKKVGPQIDNAAKSAAQQLAKTVESSEGICNAWVTMWIWNAYQNIATITDVPRKLICKKFQKYYQTTTLIDMYKQRLNPEVHADDKFMRLLREYTREFGLQVDDSKSTRGQFPLMRKSIYQENFARLADSMRNAVAGNPGVGFKLIILLQGSAHAIGLMATGADAMYIFDPNFGLYRYKDPDILRADLYCLFDGNVEDVYNFKPNSVWTLRALKKLNYSP